MERAGFCNVVHLCQQFTGFFGNFLTDQTDFSGYKLFYGHDHIVSVYGIPSGVFIICHKERGRFNAVIRQELSKSALLVDDFQGGIRFIFEPNNNRLSVVKVHLNNEADFF